MVEVLCVRMPAQSGVDYSQCGDRGARRECSRPLSSSGEEMPAPLGIGCVCICPDLRHGSNETKIIAASGSRSPAVSCGEPSRPASSPWAIRIRPPRTRRCNWRGQGSPANGSRCGTACHGSPTLGPVLAPRLPPTSRWDVPTYRPCSTTCRTFATLSCSGARSVVLLSSRVTRPRRESSAVTTRRRS